MLDVYLAGAGVMPRWCFVTLAGTPDRGWYLPFESDNPAGRTTTEVNRVAARPPTPDRATAERIRREVQTRPTTQATAEERLALLLAWARAFLRAGRQAVGNLRGSQVAHTSRSVVR